MQGRSVAGLTLALTQRHLRPIQALAISLTLGRLSAIILPNRSLKSTSTLDLTLPSETHAGP